MASMTNLTRGFEVKATASPRAEHKYVVTYTYTHTYTYTYTHTYTYFWSQTWKPKVQQTAYKTTTHEMARTKQHIAS